MKTSVILPNQSQYLGRVRRLSSKLSSMSGSSVSFLLGMLMDHPDVTYSYGTCLVRVGTQIQLHCHIRTETALFFIFSEYHVIIYVDPN